VAELEKLRENEGGETRVQGVMLYWPETHRAIRSCSCALPEHLLSVTNVEHH
jgi:hypothetical protein